MTSLALFLVVFLTTGHAFAEPVESSVSRFNLDITETYSRHPVGQCADEMQIEAGQAVIVRFDDQDPLEFQRKERTIQRTTRNLFVTTTLSIKRENVISDVLDKEVLSLLRSVRSFTVGGGPELTQTACYYEVISDN